MRHIIASLMGLLALAGCTGERVNEAGTTLKPLSEGDAAYESDQVPRIHDSFNRMKEAMAEGDTKTYFELLSSAQRATYGGYDAFVSRYTANQNGWREMWRDATIRQVAVDRQDKEKASVLVRWSTPGPHLVEFILEDGTWRFHYVVPE